MSNEAPRLATPPEKPEDVELRFRASLEDTIEVLEKLSPFTSSVDEMIETLKLAVDNATQLRLIMGKILKHTRR